MRDGQPARDRLQQILGHTGVSRRLLADGPIGWMVLADASGLTLRTRLTSYRALPLSCIAGFDVAIDGRPQDMSEAALGLLGMFHPLSALPGLSATSWFVLDVATLFIPRATPLPAGVHRVEAALRTVEPYITAGRFTFESRDARDLVTSDEEGGA